MINILDKIRGEIKFCCDRFKTRYSFENNIQYNIRIIIPEDQIREDFKYLYVFTSGYEFFSDEFIHLHIQYCPFCGTKLSKFYNNDKYANEIHGVTYDVKGSKQIPSSELAHTAYIQLDNLFNKYGFKAIQMGYYYRM